ASRLHSHVTKHAIVTALCLLPCMAPFAHAWGGDGHQIVCLIAEDRLTPSAKAAIHDLLGKDVNISDAEIANWADQVRRERRETAPWHYVDIPTNADAFDEARDGQHGNNVIDKIGDFKAVLNDLKASKAQRAEALKFLGHFVGDLHQPLHCAERNKDKGGNGRLVFFLDQPRAVNLHTVWDTTILLRRKGATRIADYADRLNSQITPEQASEWGKGTPTDWANQPHDVAVKIVYAGVPAGGPPPKLDQQYLDAAGPVVDVQLERAGVRLAAILNEVFR
ncbi:MAG TPA: S1/P1 nuclease, partial [Tepidisphaeraceae bacterium]